MNPISMTGAFVITLAFLSFGVGSVSLQRFKTISSGVLIFLTVGIILNIAATVLMIIGSHNTPFTFHGLLGYSAMLFMLADVVLIWHHYFKTKINVVVGKKLLLFSKLAYGWWVIAYITGSLMVIWK